MRRESRSALVLSLVVVAALAGAATPAAADFAFQDGDRVLVIGDSNSSLLGDAYIGGSSGTPSWSEQIDVYALMRFPTRRARLFNRAIPGTTAESWTGAFLQTRLDEINPTVAIVLLGMNDMIRVRGTDDPCGGTPGLSTDAGVRACRLARHLGFLDQTLRQILAHSAATQIPVRIYVCSYPVITGDPALRLGQTDARAFMHEMGEGQRQVALQQSPPQRFLDLTTFTEQVALAAYAAGIPTTWDGLHMSPILITATAHAALYGLGAPVGVSSVEIRVSAASGATVVAATDATVGNAAWDPATARLTFTRRDAGLPITYPLGLDGAVQLLHQDDDLAAYGVKVTGLPTAGDYRLTVDGTPVLVAKRNLWKNGINVATARPDPTTAGGTWDAQFLVASSVDHAWQLGRVLMTSLLSSPLLAVAPGDPLEDAFRRALNAHRQLVHKIAQPRDYAFALELVPEQ